MQHEPSSNSTEHPTVHPTVDSAVTVAGEPCVRVWGEAGECAWVSCFGAQVLSWQPSHGGEQLYMSRRAVLDGSAPIRGGVPIVFPQFGPRGPLGQHGFARAAVWRVEGQDEGHSLRLALHSDDFDANAPWRALWPHDFAAEFEVAVKGQALAMTLRVKNEGSNPFDFAAALHTYLSVDALQDVRLHGLHGTRYSDSLKQGAVVVDAAEVLTFAQACDRIYIDAPKRLMVQEPARQRVVSMTGFNDTVVWNPGAERCATIADMEPSDHQRMLCVEAACVLQPVALAPGQTWQGTQRIEAATLQR